MLDICKSGDCERVACPGCGMPTVLYHDKLTREMALCSKCHAKEILAEKDQDELDELVCDMKSYEASNINNEGKEGQIEYLADAGWEEE